MKQIETAYGVSRRAKQPEIFGQRHGMAGNPARELAASPAMRIFVFLLLHVPLALLMDRSPLVGTLHALVTVILGVLWAASSRSWERAAQVGMYIVGAEILWRMTGARVPWELGKYGTVLIFTLAMLQSRRLRGPISPLLYFVLLLPSLVVTIIETGVVEARELISFNLSGPFALLIGAWFFSHVKISQRQLQSLLLAALGPILGLAAIVFYGILSADFIHFGRSSNEVLSGGYGPNQVSSILALGALLAFWYLFYARVGTVQKVLVATLMLLLLAQSALTFSRGGLYTIAGSLIPAALILAQNRRARIKLVMVALFVSLVAHYVLWPYLNDFTDGALAARVTDTSRLSGRDSIVKIDLLIWRDHLVFGVGPGMSTFHRAATFDGHGKAHTEQTRMLAEHGLFGLVSLIALLIMGGQQTVRAPTVQGKAFAISMVTFSLLYMTHAAMRLAVPAFVFGLAYATILPEDEPGQHGQGEADGQRFGKTL